MRIKPTLKERLINLRDHELQFQEIEIPDSSQDFESVKVPANLTLGQIYATGFERASVEVAKLLLEEYGDQM